MEAEAQPRRSVSFHEALTSESITVDANTSACSEDPWEGVLSFLNEACCNSDPETLMNRHQMKRSMSWAERRAYKLKGAWRRLRVAFLKRGHTKPLPETAPLAHWRNHVGQLVLSPAVQGLVLVMIALDVSVTLVDFIANDFDIGRDTDDHIAKTIVDWVVVSVLAVEVVSRMFFHGYSFTHSMMNLMEFCLVPLAIYELISRIKKSDDTEGVPVPLLRALRPFLRGANLLLKATKGVSRMRQFQHQLQHQVSGNRRRWRVDGFDLDLCYIAEGAGKGGAGSLIAMGRPAIGGDAFFNNPLTEVSKFLDKMHNNNYLVINASDVIDYPVEPLRHRVLQFPVAELGVPKLIDLWDLCATMHDFLAREDNVIAVHSRIGGGRIGLVIAAYLLYINACRQAADAINLFERRLTAQGAQETVSGVDCASQQRFIEYFNVCVRELGFVPDPPRKARLKSIKLLGVEPELASRLSVKCFAHSTKTSVRSFLKPTTKQKVISRSFSNLSSATGALLESEAEEVTEEELLEKRAQLMMSHEEDLKQRAQQEHEAGVFDSYVFGCSAQSSTPLFDTDATEHAPRSGHGMDLMQSEVLFWQIKDLELRGEVCFEIHQQLTDKHGLPEEAAGTKLMLATWLHTSFLEMSSGSQGAGEEADEVNAMNNRTVCVTLQRFDLDKAAYAPSLRSYGSSFEVQLLFEVDEIMEYHWGRGSADDIERVTGKRYSADETLRLLPQDDVSDGYDAGWLTWSINKMWPSINRALHKMFNEKLEHMSVPTPVGEFPIDLECFDLGTETPEFGPIYASQRSGVRMGLQLDIAVRYKGNANIVLQSGTSRLGVTSIGLHGTLSLLFDPIVHSLPILGGMHIFFLNPPQVDLQFVGLADPLNYVILRDIIDEKLNQILADAMVLPNVLSINWMPEHAATGDPASSLASMLPTGVLRIAVTELEPITPEEQNCSPVTFARIRCDSKPPNRYAVLRLGALQGHQELSGQQIQANHSDGCDLLVYDRKQYFTVEIWERQNFGNSQLLGTSGREHMTLQDLLGGRDSQWVPLDAPGGGDLGSRIHLRSTLFQLHAESRKLPMSETSTPTMLSQRDELPQQTKEASPERPVRSSSDLSTLLATAQPVQKEDPSRDEAVALLIVSVIKGRIPLAKDEEATNYTFHVSVTDQHRDQRPFIPRDTEFWKFVNLSDTMLNTIKELSSAGFPAERIATMLKMKKEVVAKVTAYLLKFNVELPQHLCVLVPKSALKEDGQAEFQVLDARKSPQARGSVELSALWRAKGMKMRSLVNLKPTDEAAKVSEVDLKESFDLDVEIRLLAFVPHHKETTKTTPAMWV